MNYFRELFGEDRLYSRLTFLIEEQAAELATTCGDVRMTVRLCRNPPLEDLLLLLLGLDTPVS